MSYNGSLEPGDALIVSELSRLGRSVGEIITLVDRLMHHQVRVFALKEGLPLQRHFHALTKFAYVESRLSRRK